MLRRTSPAQPIRAMLRALARAWARVPRFARWGLWFALLSSALFVLGLVGYAATLELPAELQSGEGTQGSVSAAPSVQLLDRGGGVIREVLTEDRERSRPLPLAAFGDKLPQAMLAAEDKRFYDHHGVDPWALLRAGRDGLVAGRVVSGASTLTQQLARTLSSTPRTRAGKFQVMALALRIEASVEKDHILESYLNRVEFGPRMRGAEAASLAYFGKTSAELSWAEAAALASIPRGTSLYNPQRRPDKLELRRNRVLDRLEREGRIDPAQAERSRGEPLTLAPHLPPTEAPHFARALAAGKLGAYGPNPIVKTTLLAPLQQVAVAAARRTVSELSGREVSAASVVVLDNRTGDILAYVGSPDMADAKRLGHNDGVLALRQPGSTQKPFLYGLAMAETGLLPSSLLPDLPLSFVGPDGGFFRPQNYDGNFHGPVWARDALGNSFNVPAVVLAERVSVSRFLDHLKDLGIASLDRDAEHYGLALALGDGEITLLELANAYATLARGGLMLPTRAVLATEDADGSEHSVPLGVGRRVIQERIAYLVTDMLADPRARESSFGPGSVLELPFSVAAKTGTSKGYRDNLTVGYTPEVTVAVWVGNFDGSPMRDVSGITGAGPLFREVMLAAGEHIAMSPFAKVEGLREVELCSLSGALATPDCPHTRRERVLRESELTSCAMHEHRLVHVASGELAGTGCKEPVRSQVFERYPAIYGAWAERAGRPTTPRVYAARCPRAPGDPDPAPGSSVRIVYPEAGARLFTEAGRTPSIVARVSAPAGASVRYFLDGRAETSNVFLVGPGKHRLRALAGSESDEVDFTVE